MKVRRYTGLPLFALAITFLLSGCLPDAPPAPKRISMSFLAEGIGDQNSELTAGGDTLVLSEIKLYLNSFMLNTRQEVRLEARQGFILQYEARNSGLDSDQFAGELGYDDFDVFTGLELFIAPPPDSISVPDTDIVASGERFSIVLKGNFNGSEFEYKSRAELNRLLDFDSAVNIGGESEILRVRLLTDVRDFMIDPEADRILSPTDPADSSAIKTRLENSFDVEAFSESDLFES